MSRLLYFDCFSGISGDMTLGALLDAGLPLDDLRRALGSLTVGGYHVHAKRVLRAGLSATKFSVHEHSHDAPSTKAPGTAAPSTIAPQHPAPSTQHHHDHHHDHDHEHGHSHASPHRSLPEIFGLIDQSALSASGRDRAKAMFQTLAEAEAAIHQMPVEQVHLHEVGALDSIIDIVGVVFALEWVGADRIVCSPLNVGGGMVHSAHGLFPVPAPATVTLLGHAPIYSGPVQKELVTPTGALIATTYATAFGPVPAMSIERVGYGAGDRDDPSTPNVLRVLIGESADRADAERVTVIECEIDDMNPQLFGVAMDRLYAAGALEVFYVPVQMKKNRPGTLLTVVCPPALRAPLAEIVFRETTTIGLRYSEVDRECLQREIVPVDTPLGRIRFKVARRDGRVINAAPEFEDCAAVAVEKQLSVKEVQAAAVQAYSSLSHDNRSVRLSRDSAWGKQPDQTGRS
ncbi:MAG TPA: nickel pincer cofactor biosynthesis protein LarC [Vicinamibacterales bacterium]|nr:nickel pincer cofactor biosynthesis protein LarC [Vicinamibacterales bacterium]